MNSKEIFEKITQRNNYVKKCGTVRNNNYLEYLKSSSKYDSSKLAFYAAIDLAKFDGDIPEERKFLI